MSLAYIIIIYILVRYLFLQLFTLKYPDSIIIKKIIIKNYIMKYYICENRIYYKYQVTFNVLNIFCFQVNFWRTPRNSDTTYESPLTYRMHPWPVVMGLKCRCEIFTISCSVPLIGIVPVMEYFFIKHESKLI